MKKKPPVSDEELSAFLDAELPARGRAELAERLLADTALRRRLEEDRETQEALRAEFAALEGEEEAVPGRFEAQIDGLTAALSRRRRRPLVWRRLAAGLVLFAAGWGAHSGYTTYGPWRVPNVVQDAAQAHQIFANSPVRPVETSSVPLLRRWFAAHLGEDVTIPDLQSVGLHLIGGRLLSSERGPLAQMIYEDIRGQRLSLYVAVDDQTGGPEVEIVRFEAVDAGYWRDGDVFYTVVAESSVEQVIAVASAFGITARSESGASGN